ncbi:AAA family ATPase [Moellerella wisconsensis]|uniref:AAA family ATPase n=1 Tax=Moellerella wisconsensis TaxID=158849 RepID=UPI000641226E|nr:AAA family ATPase [Moellerella wisconsensis]KLN98073.1 adenylylsulfate kinase [Moellerella wisconsensis]UNH41046.1 AAA family ATPase [Moellerella wisconsensis]
MLIVFGGLPGTGKTTIAKRIAQSISACYLRIDSIEQSLIQASTVDNNTVGAAGYNIANIIADDNLKLGQIVIADCVNPLSITRTAWQNIAAKANTPLVEIEIICSDLAQHRTQVEQRVADIIGHQLPDWDNVMNSEYEWWDSADIVIDSAVTSVELAVEMILYRLQKLKRKH